MDFSNYKFRCSGLHNLMVNGRCKSDPLSETTKAYLEELWVKEVFGREKLDKANKYTIKGVMVESDSLDLVATATGKTFFKNADHLENEFINGTPDIIVKANKQPQSIIDIKSSWDIWTFLNVDEKFASKCYYYQLLGYMWLTGTKQAELMYCLVNTPEPIINDELYRLSFKIGDSEEVQAMARKNYVFDDIDIKKRLKKFSFAYDQKLVDELKNRITAAREYMSRLEL